MATIDNRSRYTVSVKSRKDLYRGFPFSSLKDAKQYASELAAERFKPTLAQKEDCLLVRIRQTGYPAFQKTFASLAEA